MYGERIVDSSGIEKTLKVNVLSQGLLLESLWPRIVGPTSGTVCSRVVFVASSLHKKASQQYEVSPSTIDILLDNKPWKPMSVYSISKLRLQYYGQFADVQMHLFKIVDDAFAKVSDSKSRPTAIAVSPGFVPQTGLARESSWLTRQLMTYVMPMFPFTTSLEEGKFCESCFSRGNDNLGAGGKTIAQAMISQNVQSGTYMSPHGEETLAAECLDPTLRAAWHSWLVSNDVRID
ncbi:putative iron reductase [Rhizoctonia solani 123E]|uniref:Putative iron reductase n=1 Tax=Rhizoctonia solani 123E TaxID=1423351 RepID=A0A074SRW1_9AGAM|nr:putative iron reductase [Rhizoctonia solani 123E]